GGADHQHAARNPAAELLKLGGIAQELDQFGNLFLRFIAARDVGERDGIVGLVEHARLALAEAERTSPAAALHLAHEEDPDADQQQHREPRDEDLREEALLFFGLRLDLDTVLDEVADHPDVAGAVGDVAFLVGRDPLDRAAFDARRFDLAALRRIHEFGIRDRILRALAGVELLDDRQHDKTDDEPDADGFHQIVQALLLAALPLPGRSRDKTHRSSTKSGKNWILAPRRRPGHE